MRLNILFILSALLVLFQSCKKEKTYTNNEGNISEDKAIAVSRIFFRSIGVSNKSSFAVDSTISIDDKNIQIPYLYIINVKPSGFIIVAAQRTVSPVLAYSTDGTIDLTVKNEAFWSWVAAWQNTMFAARTDSLNRAENQWNALTSIAQSQEMPPVTISKTIGPLLETRWNQLDGYNDSLVNEPVPVSIPGFGPLPDTISYYTYYPQNCTSSKNGHPPTGCVVTAVAQVLKYWAYPALYAWDVMPGEITDSSTKEGRSEIARLMRYVGENVDVWYSCQGSGASIGNAMSALINYGYNSGIQEYTYNENCMKSMVTDNLNHLMPVVFYGRVKKINEGHLWVCDGYKYLVYCNSRDYQAADSSVYLHMNWGWGGYADGWYLYNNFKNNYYFENNTVVCNIFPMKNAKIKYTR